MASKTRRDGPAATSVTGPEGVSGLSITANLAAHLIDSGWETALDNALDGEKPAMPEVIVLIAEDEETIAETLAMIIEDAGYVPVVAHDGRQALLLARERRPQLIVTDLMMPYINGAELIAEVRVLAAAEGYPAPPIILVTAASAARARDAGADAIVAKPFELSRIEAVVHRLMGRHN
ncbi:MAG: response regulator [Ktedonobacterales bacterium]